jgi:hypothetical protein
MQNEIVQFEGNSIMLIRGDFDLKLQAMCIHMMGEDLEQQWFHFCHLQLCIMC